MPKKKQKPQSNMTISTGVVPGTEGVGPHDGPKEKAKYRRKKCKHCLRGFKNGTMCEVCKGSGHIWTRKKLKNKLPKIEGNIAAPHGITVFHAMLPKGKKA